MSKGASAARREHDSNRDRESPPARRRHDDAQHQTAPAQASEQPRDEAPPERSNAEASRTTTLPTTELRLDVIPPTRAGPNQGEVIETERWQGSAASTPELLEQLPGTSVRRLGGVGSPTQLSIRGLGQQHVTLLLDDLPLSTMAVSHFSLASIPLESVDKIEVYRGTGPTRFSGPMGGAVRLVSRPPDGERRLSAHVGYGSQHTRSAHVTAEGPLGPLRYRAHASYQGTQGNFWFYDDRSTLYNQADDQLAQRANNDANTAHTRLTLVGGPKDAPTWRLRFRGGYDQRGVPGVGANQATAARAQSWEGAARLSALEQTAWGETLRWRAGLDAVHGQRLFADPKGELGLPVTRSRSAVTQLGTDALLTWQPHWRHALELSPRLWTEIYTQDAPRALELTDGYQSHREIFRLGAEYRVELVPDFKLVPALRTHVVLDGGATPDARSQVRAHASPRLGLWWSAGPCITQLDGGRYHRVPTLSERWGDGAGVVANPDLNAEQGWSLDGRARCELAWTRRLEAALSLGSFYRDIRELVTLLPNSARTLRAENVGRARVWGIESGLDASWWWLRADVHYTYTQGRDASVLPGFAGKQLVGTPGHAVNAGLQLGRSDWHLRYQFQFASLSYLDRANLRPIPPRLRHDVWAQARLWDTNLWLKGTLRNVTNRRAEFVALGLERAQRGVAMRSDFVGYPLPGRTFFISMLWRTS